MHHQIGPELDLRDLQVMGYFLLGLFVLWLLACLYRFVSDMVGLYERRVEAAEDCAEALCRLGYELSQNRSETIDTIATVLREKR